MFTHVTLTICTRTGIMSSIQRCRTYFQFPLAIIVFNRILLYVDDPETMEGILTAPECINKTFLQNGFYANQGLLHAKDEQWKIRRKQLNPAFGHNTLVSFFRVFNRIGNELKLKISKDMMQDNTMKFKCLENVITRAVLEASCLTTMGFETNFLQQDEKSIAQAYRYLMELTALRILKPWYQIDFIFRLLDNANYEKSKKANKMVQQFVANIVQQKHKEWQHRFKLLPQMADGMTTTTTNGAKDENGTKKYTPLNEHDTDANTFIPPYDKKLEQQPQQLQRIFIDQMFYLAQTGKLTLQDIMNESQSMVVVSFETVSSCIINALLCLAINHECQMKLRQEIKKVVLSKAKTVKNKTKTKITAPSTTTTTSSSINYFTLKRIGDLEDYATLPAEGDVDESEVNNGCSGYDDNSHADADNNDNDVGDDNDNDSDGNNGNVKVTMEHLLNMPYLDMIINESLRLLTTVPMNLRNVSADFQLNVMPRDKCTSKTTNNHIKNTGNRNDCNGSSSCSPPCCHSVVVPKDTMIALDIFNMQRNDMYWGKNALKFYPEHFSKKQQQQQQQQKQQQQQREHQEKYEVETQGKNVEEKAKHKMHETSISSTASAASRHTYAFIPFSKGLRTCIGYRYSIYLSKIVLINLISSFEVSTNIQLEDLQCYEGVSLKFRNAEKINFQIHPVG